MAIAPFSNSDAFCEASEEMIGGKQLRARDVLFEARGHVDLLGSLWCIDEQSNESKCGAVSCGEHAEATTLPGAQQGSAAALDVTGVGLPDGRTRLGENVASPGVYRRRAESPFPDVGETVSPSREARSSTSLYDSSHGPDTRTTCECRYVRRTCDPRRTRTLAARYRGERRGVAVLQARGSSSASHVPRWLKPAAGTISREG